MVTLLTNKQEVAAKYPFIGKAFQLIDDDIKHHHCLNNHRFTKLCDTYNLLLINNQLKKLTSGQLDTLCAGGVKDQVHLVRVYKLQLAHEFLNEYVNTP